MAIGEQRLAQTAQAGAGVENEPVLTTRHLDAWCVPAIAERARARTRYGSANAPKPDRERRTSGSARHTTDADMSVLSSADETLWLLRGPRWVGEMPERVGRGPTMPQQSTRTGPTPVELCVRAAAPCKLKLSCRLICPHHAKTPRLLSPPLQSVKHPAIFYSSPRLKNSES